MLPCMYLQQTYVLDVSGSAMALVKLERPEDSNAWTGPSRARAVPGHFVNLSRSERRRIGSYGSD